MPNETLLKRLREAGNDYTVAWGNGDLYDEAADEIERLHRAASPQRAAPAEPARAVCVAYCGRLECYRARRCMTGELTAESDAQDAARYRWLRDKSEPNICAFYLSVGVGLHGVRLTPATVDEAIDAAMKPSAPVIWRAGDTRN